MVRRFAALAAALVILGACGSDGTEPGGGAGDGGGSGDGATLTVYSGREEEYVEGLFDRFEEESDIELEVRYGDSAELAATIVEEGEASPADVFFSQDAGSLGAVGDAGLLAELDADILAEVDDRFRSPDGLWVGTSGRARVAAYNTDNVAAEELPDTIGGFTAGEWKGRIGFPPTNSSFQAFVAGMIATEGEEATRSFLEGLAANEPRYYEDNGSTTRAIAAGDIDVGFVNHYYVYEVAAEDGPIPVENHYFSAGDPGALVNVAGAAVLSPSDAPDAGHEFIRFLLSDESQAYFAQEIWEYPLAGDAKPSVDLLPLEEIEGPDVDLSDLGATLQPALNLLAEAGIL